MPPNKRKAQRKAFLTLARSKNPLNIAGSATTRYACRLYVCALLIHYFRSASKPSSAKVAKRLCNLEYDLMQECGRDCGKYCHNKKVSKGLLPEGVLKESPIQGKGLFADKKIGEMKQIAEYYGEVCLSYYYEVKTLSMSLGDWHRTVEKAELGGEALLRRSNFCLKFLIWVYNFIAYLGRDLAVWERSTRWKPMFGGICKPFMRPQLCSHGNHGRRW
jgi:hypothetical protein